MAPIAAVDLALQGKNVGLTSPYSQARWLVVRAFVGGRGGSGVGERGAEARPGWGVEVGAPHTGTGHPHSACGGAQRRRPPEPPPPARRLQIKLLTTGGSRFADAKFGTALSKLVGDRLRVEANADIGEEVGAIGMRGARWGLGARGQAGVGSAGPRVLGVAPCTWLA